MNGQRGNLTSGRSDDGEGKEMGELLSRCNEERAAFCSLPLIVISLVLFESHQKNSTRKPAFLCPFSVCPA
jgi:hypothetical protein